MNICGGSGGHHHIINATDDDGDKGDNNKGARNLSACSSSVTNSLGHAG